MGKAVSTAVQRKEETMSFLVTEHLDGKIVEVTVSGKLTKEVYQELVPVTDRTIQQHRQIRILFIMLGFHGWDAGALWEDFKFDLKHFSQIERLGIVGESKWQKGMSIFCRPFTTASIRYFDHADLEKAREWVKN